MILKIGAVCLLMALLILRVFYGLRNRTLYILMLPVLHERGAMDLVGMIRAFKERAPYLRYIPKLFVKNVCKAGARKGFITRRENAIIPRFILTEKGRMALDEYDWRRGKKKFPA